MLKVGIVGLPNAGKSTLFNALVVKPKAGVGQHPFTTIEKNIGVVDVLDETLFALAKAEKIDKVTPTRITFFDIAGLIKGAHLGDGLGNQFLHHIHEVDLILHVIRFFKDENVPHIHSQIDPEEDVDIVNEELLFADLSRLEKHIEKPTISEQEKIVVNKLIEALNKGTPAREVSLTSEEKTIAKSLDLLTMKRQLYVANIGVEDVKNPPKKLYDKDILSICAKLEADLSEMPWTEQQRFLKGYDLEKTAKEHIIKETYTALDIATFYTIAKHKEARAWPLRKGKTAIEAAAKIHTDFTTHFVKVEVINADQLFVLGTWQKAHELGKIGLHGKEYEVQNQDVLEFKVSIK